MVLTPRHAGCVKPRRTARKSVEESSEGVEKERKAPGGIGRIVKRQVASVSKAAQEDQPQSGKKTAGSAGRSRGLQPGGCRAAKAGGVGGQESISD